MLLSSPGDFNTFIIEASQVIQNTGVPNFREAKIPLPSPFNFDFITEELHGYPDQQLIDLLKYGFPLGHNGLTGVNKIPKNHLGATQFPLHMRELLQKDVEYRATIGPFEVPPFTEGLCLSPLNSVAKRDSDRHRLIVDLSLPKGNSIHDGIDKDWYLGECEGLTLPSVDKLADQIMKLGTGCKIF